jgi:hypothetical protein
MAIHGEPDEPRGPRFRTLVPLETPFPDVDPGEALRRAHGYAEQGWRVEALDALHTWHDAWTKAVNEHVRAQYAQAQFETSNARETDQFQAWLEHAIREGTVKAQLAIIDALEAPEWLKRYASSVRRYQVVEGPVEKEARLIDTGTFFYEIPRGS